MLKSFNLKSEVFRNILVLTSGTFLAQLVAYVLMPIITRLYTPDESAELGLFLRIIGVGAAIATARYELALPVTKLDHHSFRLYRFAIRTTVIVSLASLLLLIIPLLIAEGPSRKLFYISIPIAILLTAFMNLGTNWAIRMKRFNVISYSKLTNSIVGNVFKVIFGALGTGYIGLVLGTLVGLVISVVFFFKDFRISNKSYKINSRSARNFALAKQYVEFPKINLPHTLMDLSKDLLIVLIIWEMFGQTEYGLFNHTYQMLRLPLVLVGASIGQVFFQKCAEMINKGQSVVNVAISSVKTLLLLSIVPFATILIFGEELFAFVFGENWRESGVYAQIMAPWLMVNFITSPISSLPLILSKQRSFFLLAAFGTILMLGCLLIPKWLFDASIYQTLYITSYIQAIYLVFVIFMIFKFAKEFKNKN